MSNRNLQDPKTLIGKNVRVYRNLHKDCWSVQHNGLVVAHANVVELKGFRFLVHHGGYERFLRDGRKNVHAFVVGELVAINSTVSVDNAVEVSYNPRKSPCFHTTQPLFKGRELYFDGSEVFDSGFCSGKMIYITKKTNETNKLFREILR
jgi:hypothetical protein